MHGPPHISFHRIGELRFPGKLGTKTREPRKHVIHQNLNARLMLNVVQFATESRFYRSAPLMTQNHKNRSVKVGSSVLQTSHHFARDDIPSHAHDEQFAKVRVENQLGWNTGIAAAQNCGIRPLSFRQISEGFFANGRKSGLTPKEPFVSVDQPLQCLFSG